MRRFAVVLAFALACFVSPGCLVLSLQPVYDDASLEVDETLPGTWQGGEPAATIVVERGEWKSYRISYTSRSTSYALVGYITRIGDARFLDLSPAHGVEAVPLMIPAHGTCRLQHDGDTLTIAPLDYDYFTAAMRSKTLARLETAVDARQNLLVTSPTAALRAWLFAHLKTEAAFREPIAFTRGK